MMKSILVVFTFLLYYHNLSAQRYLDRSFESVELITDISYGTANNFEGEPVELLLDVYQPYGDIEENRPLVIYIHGGGFVDETQSKSLVHIKAYADSLAARGYVVAAINYRLDTSISNRAVINALHDANLAVRYFKANAAFYKINQDKIASVGTSSTKVFYHIP